MMNQEPAEQGAAGTKAGTMAWLRHAFACEPTEPVQPTARQREVVEALCRAVVNRRMTAPALAFLEMARPLNYIGSQALHFFSPIIATLTDADAHRHLAVFLERRGSMDYIGTTLDELERQYVSRSAG